MSKEIKQQKVSIDEKIEIFERFKQTGEEINGQTIFEGYPIGRWAIQIRSHVKKGMKLENEQQEKLEKLGILQPKIESTVDEKIQKLIEWKSKYPNAILTYSNNSVLREYSNSEEEYKELEAEYEKMKKYYQYLRERRARGKLTEQQEQKCKDGNIRGVFGTPSQIEELCKKYRINQEKIEYIIEKYGTMDNFITAYRNGKLDKWDKLILKYTLKSSFEIGLKCNRNYGLLVGEIFEQEYITEKNIKFYDIDEIKEILHRLNPREEEIVKKYFGLDNGEWKKLPKIAEEYNVSYSRIGQIRINALNKLRKFIKEDMLQKKNLNNEDTITSEEKELIREVKDIIFSSNSIFYQDEEYENEPDNIDSVKYLRYMEELKKMLSQRDSEEEQLKFINDNTPIDNLWLSVRALTRLKLAGINTFGELKYKTDEELMGIRGLGKKTVHEIRNCINGYIIAERQGLNEFKEFSSDTINLTANGEEQNKPIITVKDAIEIVNWSNRVYHTLKRANIDTIGELINKKYEELMSMKGLGENGRKEIRDKLGGYIILGASEKKTINIRDSIENLVLSSRTLSALMKAGINTISELKQTTEIELMQIKGLGKVGLKEIRSKWQIKNEDITFEQVEISEDNSELEELRKKKAELEEYVKTLEEKNCEAKKLLALYKRLLGEGKTNTDSPDFKDE